MSTIAEAFVFAYLGLTFFSYLDDPWSFDLIVAMLVILIVGRAIATIGFYKLLTLFGYERENPLSLKELIFVWYAGMIRGAIAFGLVLRITPADSINRDCIVTTCLSVVVITTVFFGSTVGLISKAFFSGEQESQLKITEEITEESSESVSSHESEDVLHPNLQPEADVRSARSARSGSTGSRKRRGCGSRLKRCDDAVLRPFLIFHYSKKHAREQEISVQNFDKTSKMMEQILIKQSDEDED